MFTCSPPNKAPHQHEHVVEAKICWGLVRPVQPIRYTDSRDIPGSMSQPQEDYLERLGALRSDMYPNGQRITSNQASRLIDLYKSGARKMEPPAEDPRLTMLKGLFDSIPTGYYAVRPSSEVNYTFIRVSEPKTGRYKTSRKIQTQHGPTYTVEAAIWPSGNWSIYRHSIIDALMLLVVDYQGAAMNYASEIGKCMRCNAELTLERSRWYGIGPECEHKPGWTWVIPTVDEREGHTFMPGVERVTL